jgi:hypothetical protein
MKSVYTKCIFLVSSVLALLIVFLTFYPPIVVEAVSQPVACQTLSVRLSDDKNYYILSATSSLDPGAVIAGYRFDFGDHESYSFIFQADIGDHTRATVDHVYEKAGVYIATARLLTKGDGKDITPSSTCTIQVSVGQVVPPASNVLVNTGTGGALALFIGATFSGAVIHSCIRTRRHQVIRA